MRREYIDIREKMYSADYGGITFYFTSSGRRDKFVNQVMPHVGVLKKRFLTQYHLCVSPEPLAALSIYRTVEPRDFLINIEGKDYSDYRLVTLTMGIRSNGEV